MIRQVGDIVYTLTQKQVKNINLRVRRDGTVCVSAHRRVSLTAIDAFVSEKAAWIETARRRAAEREAPESELSDAACLALFEAVSDRIYPAFAVYLPHKPQIRVKKLKSCWGVCHYTKGYITLNSALAMKPPAAVEYVILHEYVHFLEHDHQKGFHTWMARLMPDYKERRKLLRT